MYERILVPTDGTERAAVALAAALRLAQLGGGHVVGVHVSRADDAGTGYDSARHAAADTARQAQDALAYVTRRAREAGVPCDTVLASGGPTHDAIIRTARDCRCDLIVMAMRGRHGLAGRLLAGTTERVLAHSAIPVLVLRAH